MFVPGGQDEQGRGTQHGLTGVCAMRPCVYVAVASSVHSANRENLCARGIFLCLSDRSIARSDDPLSRDFVAVLVVGCGINTASSSKMHPLIRSAIPTFLKS